MEKKNPTNKTKKNKETKSEIDVNLKLEELVQKNKKEEHGEVCHKTSTKYQE